MVQKFEITPEDEKELGSFIVYKDDFPVFIGSVHEVMEFTGFTKNAVYSNVHYTRKGRVNRNSYKIYNIDSEDEVVEVVPKCKEYILYTKDEDGSYYQEAMGTIKDIAIETGLKECTLKDIYQRTKKGIARKRRVYRVDELI